MDCLGELRGIKKWHEVAPVLASRFGIEQCTQLKSQEQAPPCSGP
jgi:hypothetical protein